VLDGFGGDDPASVHGRLRAEAPVVWAPDPGIWVLSRHAEVAEANRDTARFCSSKGIMHFEIGIEYPSPPTMMHTDAPVHTRLRRAVAAGFRPSRIRALEPSIAGYVRTLVDALPADEPFDVVAGLAAPLPLMVICDLLGLPSTDWPLFWQWSDAVIPGAAEIDDVRRAELNADLESLLRRHIAHRRALAVAGRLGEVDDIVADLVAAGHADGAVDEGAVDEGAVDEPLDDEEVYILLNQLLIAGNETTRNLISGGMVALAERPGEWERLRRSPDLVGAAVEEMLRWTTPVPSFMRTATCDTDLGGQCIAEGDPVLLLWAAANRDPAEFGDDAGEFRVGRSPNHHLAFGYGPHFCVGAALARLEGRLVLEAMLDRFASLAVAGEVRRSPSTIIAGLEEAVLRGSPATAGPG
jgi:cytochrome P450